MVGAWVSKEVWFINGVIFSCRNFGFKDLLSLEFLVTLLWVGKNISWNYKLSRTIPDVLIRFLTMYCVYLCFLFVY